MILVKKYTGGKLTFRTSRGSITGQVIKGYVVVHVSPLQAKALRAHKFHAPPAGFSLEEAKPVKEVKKKAPAPKKKTTKKKSTSKK